MAHCGDRTDEYAIIFSGLAMMLAVTLAVASWRELFSRMVLVGATIFVAPVDGRYSFVSAGHPCSGRRSYGSDD